MADDPDDLQAEAEATPVKPAFSIRATARSAAQAAGRFLPRLGLHLFLIAVPVLILGYPALQIASRLLDYAATETFEATLVRIDIRDVRDPDKKSSLLGSHRHFDVVFSFAGEQGKQYLAIIQKSWPSPGLRRRLEAQYPPGDVHTLRRTSGNQILMESEVAKDSFAGMTTLMGLLFAASLLYYLLRSRLASRMPSVLPRASAATAKSVVFGQLITLLLAALFVPIIGLAPILVPPWLYFGAYGAISLILCLSLRLLVFENAPAASEANDIAKRIAKA